MHPPHRLFTKQLLTFSLSDALSNGPFPITSSRRFSRSAAAFCLSDFVDEHSEENPVSALHDLKEINFAFDNGVLFYLL